MVITHTRRLRDDDDHYDAGKLEQGESSNHWPSWSEEDEEAVRKSAKDAALLLYQKEGPSVAVWERGAQALDVPRLLQERVQAPTSYGGRAGCAPAMRCEQRSKSKARKGKR